ncbi:MAG: 5-formyltetrahydrofolate cyclo-ligase [Bdellovibrionota bacterium]
MKNLELYLKNQGSQNLSTQEQKKLLRKHMLIERENTHKYADPQNWGPKQFFRSLELLKINDVADLENKYLIACFFPIRHELDLSSFATSQWLFPKIHNNNQLLWFEYGDGKTNYIENKYGIKEKEDKYCFSYGHDFLPMLCFIPGIAAAQDGTRLGYGGGFYDKFLSEFKDKVTSVLCLPSREFLFDTLPYEEHDEKVDLIVF